MTDGTASPTRTTSRRRRRRADEDALRKSEALRKYALSKQADKAEQAARKLAAKEEQGDATREEVATAEADARVARARAHTGTGAHHRFQRNACRITIKALLDGLTRFYNPSPIAASSAAASSLPSSADAAASSSTARHLG